MKRLRASAEFFSSRRLTVRETAIRMGAESCFARDARDRISAIRGKRRTGSKAVLKATARLQLKRANPTPGHRCVPDVSLAKHYLPARVRLVDRNGEFVRWCSSDEAAALICADKVEILYTRKKIHAIRWRQPEPDLSRRRFTIRRAGFGDAHRRETYENPKGVWTLDSIRSSNKRLFTTVRDEIIVDPRGKLAA